MTDVTIIPHRTDRQAVNSLSKGDTVTIAGDGQYVVCNVEETNE